MDTGHLMTQESYDALRKEVEHLETVEREAIAKQIKTAREWGDLKENAEYHAAKDAQAHLETKILTLREQLDNADIVEKASGGIAGIGSVVEVQDEQTGRTTTYTLVPVREAVPAEGKLSLESPVGEALKGRRAGEVATVQTPRGERRLQVVSIS